MDVFRTVIPKGVFYTGNGGADSVATPIAATWGFPEIFKGILPSRGQATTPSTFSSDRGVTPDNGFPLSKTRRLFIQVDDPTSIYVCADPASNSTQTVTLSGDGDGDTFTLTYGGESTRPDRVPRCCANSPDPRWRGFRNWQRDRHRGRSLRSANSSADSPSKMSLR